ncbi:MAG: hypothetical protein CVU57_00535 [Deltaproteobacteria bacterium HGW-Deltaproteobacteria-15]|jgi:L-aspartate oxidase|nr:MAG: hypothetical protein CVU57_00535 [Deltaproteobacteria bacterium HGW-Deltaproteobacteria-15]
MFAFEDRKADVLVIGAGAAGVRAALAASHTGAEVTLVSKGPITKSGSSFSSLSGGWGIQALVGTERTEQNLEDFYNDIIEAGLGVCDPGLARILVEESGPRLQDLLAYGLLLRKDDKGKPLRVKGCFSHSERAFLTENVSNIRETFQTMLNASGAKVLVGAAAELIVLQGGCRGAWLVTSDRRIVRVMAQATVLATGGGAGLFEDHLASEHETGEGYALAHHAGAELKNLEFIQFMLGIKENGRRRFLPLSELDGPGALLDSDGRDIIMKHIQGEENRKRAVEERMAHHPFSTRDSSYLIDLGLAKTRSAGKRAFWRNGNPAAKRAEVAHMAHAFNGGAAFNDNGETTVPGLFAAGEVAAGPHGADRIGGCMMTATQVFGERAGRSAATRAMKKRTMPVASPPSEILLKKDPEEKRSCSRNLEALAMARDVFSRELMVLRNRRGLEECLSTIEHSRQALVAESDQSILSLLTGEHMLTAMQLIAAAAFKRGESLGPHCRADRGSTPDSPIV